MDMIGQTGPQLAVLIDGDNIPAKFADPIFEEISKLGQAGVRRIYGDFASGSMSGWASVAARIGAVPYHHPANTKGKNATDIGLVIDAMDLLHTNRFQGFVLVSSDSDFTRLASRIREHGMIAIGIGEKKTPQPLVNACNRFIYVESLVQTEEKGSAKKSDPSMAEARDRLLSAFESVEQEDGWTTLSEIGNQLSKRHSDFDPRNYGVRKLSQLIEKTGKFQTEPEGRQIKVRLKSKGGK